MTSIEIITDANDTRSGKCLNIKPLKWQLRKNHKKLANKTQMQDSSRVDIARRSDQLHSMNQEKEIAKMISECINEQRSLKTWSRCV